MFTVPRTSVLLLLVGLLAVVSAQDEPASTLLKSDVECKLNQLFNGKKCECAPGYFSSVHDDSKSRCDDECEEVYYSLFTTGECVKGIFGKLPKDQQPECNLRCGMRLRTWFTAAVFTIIAAAVATLVFTLPLCIATCSSCLNAKKANKNAKRVFNETQQPSKDQQMATMQYNPYAYWPYYGRA